MEWKKDIEELYEDITDQVPEAFRASVKPMLREAAEKTARLRNSVFVSRDDLLSTLFENVERNYRIKDRIENFYRLLRKKRYGSYFIQNGTKSKYKLNNYYENLRYSYYSVFEKFLIFHLKNHYPYPNIYNITNFDEFYQLGGIA